MKPIERVVLPDYEYRFLPNGRGFLVVDSGLHEVFKLEAIFHAGRFHETKKMVSGITLRMLREGSNGFSSEDVAEKVDYFGASLITPANLDFSGPTMYGLNQHFGELLPLFRQVTTAPLFPETEFKDHIREKKQQLQVDLSKIDTVAYRQITEMIFGPDHPYGYNSTPAHYDAVTTDDLREHFDQHYRTGNCTIVLSGRISQKMIDQLEQELFPHIPEGHSEVQSHTATPSTQQELFIPRPNAVQTAIRMGKRLFDRKHPDFFGMYFLNIILGDYFSSRLMMNIREEKGYTYNIYSMTDLLRFDGTLLVATEVANEYTQDTIKEIHREFARLRDEPIPKEELDMARNYTLGTLLAAMDGPLNSSEVIKGLILNDVNATFFKQLIDTIKHITAEELQELANKYLQEEQMYTVKVGRELDVLKKEY
jgi:predicted Zn-dependent peptidase